ncbi:MULTISPECIES: M14 family metallocarboxypeptidase [unclassified Ruminococcus]|uniref:M14 family metallopeptidase n=1 Tax=unclassified Ruminococcus TaxID=2608920 RepID=UPI00210DF45C|nr:MULTISPECIES: M14 family metallocarboxypeptidase [unclassified Ruminococcus]MCQ4023092.1 gamma-D-glutamyl-meso-diaminopimelate peptidase [Ruminococcus sp. zg-924]MCQ4115529.1 gamma-D-glutamyl-meso-diaminopimelate peptidase [Ruminococcus sp. zg-921]
MVKTKYYDTPADEQNRARITKMLTEQFPFLKREQIGVSRCGRSIDAFSLGNEDEQVLMCGAFHGMEWLTSLLLFRFLKEVCRCVKSGGSIRGINIDRFLNRRGLIVVPCVNPDGVEISLNGECAAGRYERRVSEIANGKAHRWQANAFGVDINHNFSAGWRELKQREKSSGITAPSITQYGGEMPESEPETKALTKLCRSRNIRHATAFHSQGEEIYWSYGSNTPKKSRLMAEVMARTSGYALSSPSGLAVGGGFKDWFIEELSKPAFTVEIGCGRNPLPASKLDEIYNRLEEMLALCVIM